MYWLPGFAPAGPSMARVEFDISRLDLQGVYPVSLLRFFIPSPFDFRSEGNLQSTFKRWWAGHVISSIRASGLRYNTIEGRAGYGVSCCGGSLNWDEWIKRVNPLVNSFDLAALVQVGCILLDPRMSWGLELRWICQSKHGYIQPSMPFGWEGDQKLPQGANNPFFSGLGTCLVARELLEIRSIDQRTQLPTRNLTCLEIRLRKTASSQCILELGLSR